MGWLPWPESEILDAPIVRLLWALEGRVEVFKRTWPWGKKEEQPGDMGLSNQPVNNAELAKKIAAWARARQAEQQKT